MLIVFAAAAIFGFSHGRMTEQRRYVVGSAGDVERADLARPVLVGR